MIPGGCRDEVRLLSITASNQRGRNQQRRAQAVEHNARRRDTWQNRKRIASRRMANRT
jgi:hypothetical protein